jgi:hypothetical protein
LSSAILESDSELTPSVVLGHPTIHLMVFAANNCANQWRLDQMLGCKGGKHRVLLLSSGLDADEVTSVGCILVQLVGSLEQF